MVSFIHTYVSLPDAGAISTSAEFLFVFLLKILIMGTGKNNLGEAVLTSTHNVFLEQKLKRYPRFTV